MKRIKQIIEALKVISDKPSLELRTAMESVIADADLQDDSSDRGQRMLVEKVMQAVIAMAEDMEKPPAKGDEKA